MNLHRHLAWALAAALALAGCNREPAPAAAPVAATAPADPALARLYDQTCRSCHANPATGAPAPGDEAAWRERRAQGLDVLVEHTVNGIRGMPPMGSCMDCSEDDFRALIRFMAGIEG